MFENCDCEKWYKSFVSSLAKRAAIKQLSKLQSERLSEIEEQFLYLRELPDEVRFLQTRLEGLD